MRKAVAPALSFAIKDFLMSIKGYSHSVTERFMRYVKIDTQSDPASLTPALQ